MLRSLSRLSVTSRVCWKTFQFAPIPTARAATIHFPSIQRKALSTASKSIQFEEAPLESEVVEDSTEKLTKAAIQLTELLEVDRLSTAQCNSLINTLLAAELYDKMFKVLVMMEGQGPPPNKETYTLLKEAAERLGRQDWADQLAAKI